MDWQPPQNLIPKQTVKSHSPVSTFFFIGPIKLHRFRGFGPLCFFFFLNAEEKRKIEKKTKRKEGRLSNWFLYAIGSENCRGVVRLLWKPFANLHLFHVFPSLCSFFFGAESLSFLFCFRSIQSLCSMLCFFFFFFDLIGIWGVHVFGLWILPFHLFFSPRLVWD